MWVAAFVSTLAVAGRTEAGTSAASDSATHLRGETETPAPTPAGEVLQFDRKPLGPGSLVHQRAQECAGAPGFAVVECNGEEAVLKPIPGAWVNGAVSPAEADFITKCRDFIAKHNIKFLYDVGSQGTSPEHLSPLYHVLPGRYVSLGGPAGTVSGSFDGTALGLLPDAVAKAVEPVGPEELASALLNSTHVVLTLGGSPIASLAHTAAESRRKLGLSPNEYDWVAYRQIVFLPQNDGESQFWTYYFDLDRDSDNGMSEERILEDVLDRHVLRVATRPFQDLQFSRFWRSYRYADYDAVFSHVQAQAERVHLVAPCTQRKKKCLGVATVVVPAALERPQGSNRGCQLDLGALRKLMWTWKVSIHLDAECDAPSSPPMGLFINQAASGLSLMDMVAMTDVVITFTSDSLVPILGSRIDVPVVRVLPDIRKYYNIMNRVFNASMGRVVPTFDDRIGDAVVEAVRMMAQDREAVLRYRAGYAQRYWWRLDGYEEYRAALQILSLSAPEASSAELGELLASLKAFSLLPPRPPALYGYTYPPSKLFLGATTRNTMVWSAVKKAFFQARIGPTRKKASPADPRSSGAAAYHSVREDQLSKQLRYRHSDDGGA